MHAQLQMCQQSKDDDIYIVSENKHIAQARGANGSRLINLGSTHPVPRRVWIIGQYDVTPPHNLFLHDDFVHVRYACLLCVVICSCCAQVCPCTLNLHVCCCYRLAIAMKVNVKMHIVINRADAVCCQQICSSFMQMPDDIAELPEKGLSLFPA